MTTESGSGLIVRERLQQINKWPIEHDDEHGDGQLIDVADCLLMHDVRHSWGDRNDWGLVKKHPDRIKQLTIAGALIAAEIDRLQRLAVSTPEGRLRRIARIIDDVPPTDIQIAEIYKLAMGVT